MKLRSLQNALVILVGIDTISSDCKDLGKLFNR